MAIEIQRQLVLSTAHLSKSGRAWLDAQVGRASPPRADDPLDRGFESFLGCSLLLSSRFRCDL